MNVCAGGGAGGGGRGGGRNGERRSVTFVVTFVRQRHAGRTRPARPDSAELLTEIKGHRFPPETGWGRVMSAFGESPSLNC